MKIEVNLLRDKLQQSKKRRSLLQNGLKQIAKSFTKWTWANHKNTKTIAWWTRGNCREEKNWKLCKMSKEELAIALLKSKRSLAELFNNNFNNDRIKGIKKNPQWIKR